MGDDGRWLGVTLDPSDIAVLLMEMIVPKLSDGGAVFVLERGHGSNNGQIVTRRLASRFVQWDGHPVETVLPAGEVFAFPVDSPYGVCLTSGTPQRFGGPDAVTMKRVRPAGRELLSHHSAFLAVPLTAAGDVTGVLVTSRSRGRGPYTDADVAAIAGLAGRAGTGIAHAAEFARHRRDSRALQEGLVPGPPPVPGRVEVAWRSTPAPGEVVGGDWWDIVTLPGMRTGLVVGDVMGHGSAAVMLLALFLPGLDHAWVLLRATLLHTRFEPTRSRRVDHQVWRVSLPLFASQPAEGVHQADPIRVHSLRPR